MARDADGLAIRALCIACHFDGVEACTFAKVEPNWVIAERDGALVGCMQVMIGYPMGRYEFQAVDPALPSITRGRIVRLLFNLAMSVLRRGGCEMAQGVVPFEHKSYKKVMKRRGGVVICAGNLMANRL